MAKFQGRLALITGSGTGIGQTIARRFVEEGASVIIMGRRKEPLASTAQMLEKIIGDTGSNATVRVFDGVDVADEAGINGMFDALKADGATVDYVINNAGVSGPVTCFANAPLDEFKGTVGIHLTGTFWTSVRALDVMKEGGKIVTISTFFTEERPLEQRPYRFRSPYTASQGAKNRLAETMSWELAGRGIVSIATNPGPVHSDRIYKTVYPKAASEFMRVSGFEDLSPEQVEEARDGLLGCIEAGGVNADGIAETAARLACGRDVAALTGTYTRLLGQIQKLAGKIQSNTSHMIADQEFLRQDEVAETVLSLCGDRMARTLNGKVIPGDRVFYPVRAHVGAAAPKVRADYAGGAVVFTVDATDESDAATVEYLAAHVEKSGGKAACFVSRNAPKELQESVSAKFHTHIIDVSDPAEVARWLKTAEANLGRVLALVHVTGNMPEIAALTGLGRKQWDDLVARFITTPAAVSQRALEHFVPGGGRDPRLFKGASGSVLIVGPGLPAGRKAPGVKRMQVEVFRGALRPLVTTINQELSDVLKSDVRVFAALPGSVTGAEPDSEGIAGALDFAVSPDSRSSAEVVFCVDEAR